jgi:Thioredoxin
VSRTRAQCRGSTSDLDFIGKRITSCRSSEVTSRHAARFVVPRELDAGIGCDVACGARPRYGETSGRIVGQCECPYCRQVELGGEESPGQVRRQGQPSLPRPASTPNSSSSPDCRRSLALRRRARQIWEYHDQLFSAPKLDHDALVDYARTLKLDDKQFDSCLKAEKYKTDIDKDLTEGMAAGITGTPGFFINGIPLSGSQPEESFRRLIDDELARKRRGQCFFSALPVVPGAHFMRKSFIFRTLGSPPVSSFNIACENRKLPSFSSTKK